MLKKLICVLVRIYVNSSIHIYVLVGKEEYDNVIVSKNNPHPTRSSKRRVTAPDR